MLGYWHPGQHELKIGNTVIEAGTKVIPSTIIPSVQILALDVHFEICNESLKTDKPTGLVNLDFWQKACPEKFVHHIKKLVIHEFHGKRNEVVFVKFMVETVQALEKVVIMRCPQSFSSEIGYDAEMKPFTTAKL
ncbi:hypothetical protein PR202_gb00687 [Eleusine coracana subsp. coracana]|uniref:FBD domain-containing protein n=1 Tax=Eleusine coracana subsp. coracana TaxID=191504 RepID=A0AAV5DT76_ELECO|nr:hypothetical protein PR202_gb00687 [Eleusine coracana subsp. coracana]